MKCCKASLSLFQTLTSVKFHPIWIDVFHVKDVLKQYPSHVCSGLVPWSMKHRKHIQLKYYIVLVASQIIEANYFSSIDEHIFFPGDFC